MSILTCQIRDVPNHDEEEPVTATAESFTEQVPATHKTTAGSVEPTTRQLMRATVTTLFLDAGLSVLAYAGFRLAGASPFTALVAGAVVALARAGWVLARRREVDPFALFMVGIYVAGLATSFVTGSPRFLLVKESFGTAAAGLAFVLTCLRGKPLAFHASARVAAADPHERAEWEQLWVTEPVFRHRFVVMSLVIGGVLLAEAAVRIPFVFLLPVDVMAVVSPILTPVVITLTSVWAVRYGTGTEAAVKAAHADDEQQAAS